MSSKKNERKNSFCPRAGLVFTIVVLKFFKLNIFNFNHQILFLNSLIFSAVLWAFKFILLKLRYCEEATKFEKNIHHSDEVITTDCVSIDAKYC